MSNPIDELYKDHLNSRHLEYQPEQWQHMHALIEAENSKKRRKRAAWYGTGAVALLSLAGFYWFTLSPGNNGKDATEAQLKTEAADIHAGHSNSGKTDLTGSLENSEQTTAGRVTGISDGMNRKNGAAHVSGGSHSPETRSVRTEKMADLLFKTEEKIIVERGNESRTEGIEVAGSRMKTESERITESENELSGETTEKTESTEAALLVSDNPANPQITAAPASTRGKNKTDHIKPKDSTRYWSLGIFGAGSNGYQTTGSKRFENDASSEVPGYTAGAGAMVYWQKGMFKLGTGAGFQTFRGYTSYFENRVKYTYTYSLVLKSKNVGTSFSGNPIAQVQKIKDSTGSGYTVQITNRSPYGLHYVQIPLQAGLVKRMGRWELEAWMGVQTAILASQKGKYATEMIQGNFTAQELSVSRAASPVLFRSMAGVGLGFSPVKKLTIMARAELNRSMGSVFRTHNERFHYQMLGLGIGYRL